MAGKLGSMKATNPAVGFVAAQSERMQALILSILEGLPKKVEASLKRDDGCLLLCDPSNEDWCVYLRVRQKRVDIIIDAQPDEAGGLYEDKAEELLTLPGFGNHYLDWGKTEGNRINTWLHVKSSINSRNVSFTSSPEDHLAVKQYLCWYFDESPRLAGA